MAQSTARIAVHIYPLSKLVHAFPGDWENLLKAIEGGKVRAYTYYQPLREAVVMYCRSKGKRYDDILHDLVRRANEMPAPKGADPAKDNSAAFESFVQNFHPRIARFEKSLLKTDSENGCIFAGVRLLGSPHFVVTDESGKERYVFLHASKWDDDDLKAYVELLAMIVESRFGKSSDSIWCMDLRNGTDLKWRRSSRVLGRCEKAATLYSRFVAAMSSPS